MSTSLADEQLFDHQLCGRPLQAAARHRKIHQIDPQTRAVLRTIETDRIITGMTWVAGELRRGTWQDESSDVGHIDPETEKVFERLEMPDGTVASGHESDGGGRFSAAAEAPGPMDAGPVRGLPRRRPRNLSGLIANFLTPGGFVLRGSWGRMRHIEPGKPRLGCFGRSTRSLRRRRIPDEIYIDSTIVKAHR